MRYFLGILALAGLVGCAEEPESASLNVRVWQPTAYSLCDLTPKVALPRPIVLTGYRTALPYGRYDSQMSFRPYVLSGLSSEDIGSPLITKPGQEQVQAYDWSAATSQIIVTKLWEEPQHAMLEQAQGVMSITADYYRADGYLYNTVSKTYTNVTAAQGPSFYNVALAFMPDGRLLLQSYINEQMRGFTINPNGTGVKALTETAGFAYGLSVSPDGTRYAFHSNYKVYVGNYASGTESLVSTTCSFNFGPVWSADSQHIAFLCGEHDAPDLWVADRDGFNSKPFASRHAYAGVLPYTDEEDYHGGGTDNFAWTPDSQSIVYGANAPDGSVELFKTTLSGSTIKLTNHRQWAAHPAVTPDGQYLAYSVGAGAQRNLWLMNMQTSETTQVTDVGPTCGVRYPKWQP